LIPPCEILPMVRRPVSIDTRIDELADSDPTPRAHDGRDHSATLSNGRGARELAVRELGDETKPSATPSFDTPRMSTSAPPSETLRLACHAVPARVSTIIDGEATACRAEAAMKLQSGETTTGVKRGPAPTSPSSIQPAGMPNPESARRSQTDEFPASSQASPTMSPASLPPIGIADTVPGGSGMSSRRNLWPSAADGKEYAAVEVANAQNTTARISVRSRVFRFFRRVFPASAGARAACPGDQAVRSSHQPRRTTRASHTAIPPATYPPSSGTCKRAHPVL
jgi:cell pole-organizing protein PopZ